MRLHGTCNHQDHAGVGAAIPDALQEFRVKQLKEFGCNAFRTAHNPPTPELLDACDRLGMLVMDESRLLGSDSENLRKWDEQIRRDRNHPSVAIWSIANEELTVQDTPQAANVALTMQNYVKRLDPTRPVTYAAPKAMSSAASTPSSKCAAGITTTARAWTNTTPSIPTSRTSAPSRPASSARAASMPTTSSADTSAPTTSSGRAGKRPPKAGGATSPIARGFPAVSCGPGLTIAVNRRPVIGRASARISAFSTRAAFRRMLSITINRGGRRHGAAPGTALELARQGRPGHPRRGPQQLQRSGAFPERHLARQTGDEAPHQSWSGR